MAGRLLARGMLLGIVAACLMVLFAELFGEPQVAHAIAFEAAADRAAGLPADPAIVSRAVQRGVGLLTAALLYGAAFGGMFALAFAACLGRIGRVAPRPLAAWLALAGFVAVVLVPDLKYPPNPPSVGHAASIGLRTALYLEAIAASLCALVLAVLAGRRVASRRGAWDGALAGLVLFVAIAAAALAIMPDIDEVPAAFPAVLLWRFRVAALGMQAVLWSTLGVCFGAAAETLLLPPGHGRHVRRR